MTKKQIQVGSTYTAKVSGRLVPVRIQSEHPVSGWIATNLDTHRWIHIRTAGRLRPRVPTHIPERRI